MNTTTPVRIGPVGRFLVTAGASAAGILMLAGGAARANPPLPLWNQTMRPGIAAMTCTSSGQQTPAGLAEHVVALIDLRDAVGCGATPIITRSSDWLMPPSRMFWDPGWSVANLGEVFGVDVGTGPTSDIYVSALGPKPCDWGNSYWANRSYATAANDTGTGGEVWCLDGTTYTRQLIACLPNHRGFFSGASTGVGCTINGNSFVGLGNLSYCQPYQTLYVTNLDDGKIYVVSVASLNCGAVLCTFDHGAQPSVNLPDNPQQLYTQRHRMVFGIEYHPQSNRLFYALRNALNQDEVWSIALDATGCPTGAPCLELTNGPFPPLTNGAPSNLPSDIQFSPDGRRLLVIHQSVTFFPVTVTNITPPGTYAPSQDICMRYAHHSLPWEFYRPTAATCGGWALQGAYSTGLFYSQQNAVAGDYGYGGMLATPALDSVVTVAEVIRAATPGPISYKFGLQIHPVGDYSRSNTAMNFDAPLLASTGSAATKIQLNDLDVLHQPPCMSVAVVPGSVQCPPTPGGNATVQIQVTNLLPYPVFGLSLTDCSPQPLPPGAVGITPVPVALPGGILNPGATTPPLTISLPGLPPSGGTVCFCVRLLDESPEGVQCEEMVCVNFPCVPPCMSLAAQNVRCDPAGGYTLDLCLTNLSPTPITTVSFSPCAPVPPGAATGVPAVNPVTLVNPLPNGATVCLPLSFPALPPAGGLFCFNVSAGGDPAGGASHPCTDKICVTLPPCSPPCAEVTATEIKCPTAAGGDYTLTLTIKNLTAAPVGFVNIGQCPPGSIPPGAVSVLPAPAGYLPLIPPLAPGATTSLPLSLPGLPCTGVRACFCLSLLGASGSGSGGGDDPEEPPAILCQETVCVDLPACDCPPCMSVATGNIRCPDAPTGPYLLGLQITNLSGATAGYYGLTPCPPAPGAVTLQPGPAGVVPLPGPLTTGSTTPTLTVTLPAPLTGGPVCFCVVLLAPDQQTILCRQRVCVTLPRCACAEAAITEVTCLPGGQTQLVVSVTNNTHLYASPHAFALATVSPATGFTPAVAGPTPGPIAPGSSGTIILTYSGPPGPKCVTLVMSNTARTRCCPVQVCFDNPECEPQPPAGTCALRDTYFCENGTASVTFYLTNNTGSPAAFAWSLAPATVPGCTSSLPPAAFTPASGTTPTLAPFSTAGVTVSVNAGTVAAGTCAGFQVCFVPASNPAAAPVCCLAKIRCPRLADPCVFIGDPLTLASRGRVIGLPVVIKNPTDAVIDTSLVFTDDTGALEFFSAPPTADTGTPAAGPGEVIPWNPYADRGTGEITEDRPLRVTLAPGQTQELTVVAKVTGAYRAAHPVGTIIVRPPCVLNPEGGDHGTGRILFGPPVADDGAPPPPPIDQAMGVPRLTTIAGRPARTVSFHPTPGLPYILEGTTELPFGNPAATYRIPPHGPGVLIEPDGSFLLPAGPTDLSILELPALSRELYRFAPAPAGGAGTMPPVSGGR